MARIDTYRQDASVTGLDEVLGTDSTTGGTRVYSMNSIQAFLNLSGLNAPEVTVFPTSPNVNDIVFLNTSIASGYIYSNFVNTLNNNRNNVFRSFGGANVVYDRGAFNSGGSSSFADPYVTVQIQVQRQSSALSRTINEGDIVAWRPGLTGGTGGTLLGEVHSTTSDEPDRARIRISTATFSLVEADFSAIGIDDQILLATPIPGVVSRDYYIWNGFEWQSLTGGGGGLTIESVTALPGSPDLNDIVLLNDTTPTTYTFENFLNTSGDNVLWANFASGSTIYASNSFDAGQSATGPDTFVNTEMNTDNTTTRPVKIDGTEGGFPLIGWRPAGETTGGTFLEVVDDTSNDNGDDFRVRINTGANVLADFAAISEGDQVLLATEVPGTTTKDYYIYDGTAWQNLTQAAGGGGGGAPGPQGPEGPQGRMGTQGDQGDKGDMGNTGSQGGIGMTGTQGNTGPRGEQGVEGVDGTNSVVTFINNQTEIDALIPAQGQLISIEGLNVTSPATEQLFFGDASTATGGFPDKRVLLAQYSGNGGSIGGGSLPFDLTTSDGVTFYNLQLNLANASGNPDPDPTIGRYNFIADGVAINGNVAGINLVIRRSPRLPWVDIGLTLLSTPNNHEGRIRVVSSAASTAALGTNANPLTTAGAELGVILQVTLETGNIYAWDGAKYINIIGVTGPSGADGMDGSDGTRGMRGETGPRGLIGPAGEDVDLTGLNTNTILATGSTGDAIRNSPATVTSIKTVTWTTPIYNNSARTRHRFNGSNGDERLLFPESTTPTVLTNDLAGGGLDYSLGGNANSWAPLTIVFVIGDDSFDLNVSALNATLSSTVDGDNNATGLSLFIDDNTSGSPFVTALSAWLQDNTQDAANITITLTYSLASGTSLNNNVNINSSITLTGDNGILLITPDTDLSVPDISNLVTTNTAQIITADKTVDANIIMSNKDTFRDFDNSQSIIFNDRAGFVASISTGSGISLNVDPNIRFIFPSFQTPMRIFSDNVALGGGVAFGQTGATTPDAADVLDDYEEGTWAPVGSSPGVTLSNISDANYTKVGNNVYVTARFVVSNAIGTTNKINYSCTGLPFISSSIQVGSLIDNVSAQASTIGTVITTAFGFIAGHATTLLVGDTETATMSITYLTNA